jgi:predicted ester cyclase
VLGAGRIDWALEIWSQLIDGLGIQLTIEELIMDGERAVVRFSERGVFRGPFMGAQPTGKFYELVALEWFVIRGGLIHSRWAARGAASSARQIVLHIK